MPHPRWGGPKYTVAQTHTCRPPVDPPVTITDLIRLMANALDEGLLTQRLGGWER